MWLDELAHRIHFAYHTRRSTSSLVRRRVWVFSPQGEITLRDAYCTGSFRIEIFKTDLLISRVGIFAAGRNRSPYYNRGILSHLPSLVKPFGVRFLKGTCKNRKKFARAIAFFEKLWYNNEVYVCLRCDRRLILTVFGGLR